MFDFILKFFEGIYNLGPILMVPAIMFLLGLVFGMGLEEFVARGIADRHRICGDLPDPGFLSPGNW